MTDTTKAQILDLARKAINTEMLALKHMKETLGDNFADAVELILACSGKCIVTGMGKSGLVGRKIAATLASTGTPSFFLHPGEAFHGDLGMISKDDVVLALSYSGETDEILKIVPFIHSNGNKLVIFSFEFVRDVFQENKSQYNGFIFRCINISAHLIRRLPYFLFKADVGCIHRCHCIEYFR